MADERTRLMRFTAVHRLWHLGLVVILYAPVGHRHRLDVF